MPNLIFKIVGYAAFILLPLLAILGVHLALAYQIRQRARSRRLLWLLGLSVLIGIAWPIVIWPLAFTAAFGSSEAGIGLGLPGRLFDPERGFFIFLTTTGLPLASCSAFPVLDEVLTPFLYLAAGPLLVSVGLFLLGLVAFLPGQVARGALMGVWVGLGVIISLYSWQGGSLGDIHPLARAVPLYPNAVNLNTIDQAEGPQAQLRVYFYTDGSPKAVQDFYRQALPAEGWLQNTAADGLEFARPAEEDDRRTITVNAKLTGPPKNTTQVELSIKDHAQ